jgi:hypothetical protein
VLTWINPASGACAATTALPPTFQGETLPLNVVDAADGKDERVMKVMISASAITRRGYEADERRKSFMFFLVAAN